MGVPDIPLGQGNYRFDDHLTEATTTDQQNMNLQWSTISPFVINRHYQKQKLPCVPKIVKEITENR